MPEPDKKERRKPGTKAGGAEASRSSTVLVAFKVPVALADRLEALTARLSTPWHEMSRSAAARIALERGLDAFDQEDAKPQDEEGSGSA